MKTSFKVIETEEAYQKAVKRAMAIFHAEEGTTEAYELAVLLLQVRAYENKIDFK